MQSPRKGFYNMDINSELNVPAEKVQDDSKKKFIEPPSGLGRFERVRFLLDQKIARNVHPMNRKIVLAYFSALEPEPDFIASRGLPPLPELGMQEEIRIIFKQFPALLRNQLEHELESV